MTESDHDRDQFLRVLTLDNAGEPTNVDKAVDLLDDLVRRDLAVPSLQFKNDALH